MCDRVKGPAAFGVKFDPLLGIRVEKNCFVQNVSLLKVKARPRLRRSVCDLAELPYSVVSARRPRGQVVNVGLARVRTHAVNQSYFQILSADAEIEQRIHR